MEGFAGRFKFPHHQQKYKNPQALFEGCKNYFDEIEIHNEQSDEKKKRYPTYAGLCSFLGISKGTFYNYAQHEDLEPIITQAKLYIESVLEERLYHSQASGAMFNLTNNHGWKNEKYQKNTVEGEVKFVIDTGVLRSPKDALKQVEERAAIHAEYEVIPHPEEAKIEEARREIIDYGL